MDRNTVFAQVTDPRGELKRSRRKVTTFERMDGMGDTALRSHRIDSEDTPGQASPPTPFGR